MPSAGVRNPYAAAAGERPPAYSFGDAAHKANVQMHNSPKGACYFVSIALSFLDRSRQVSSG
jgi:hypothetical protein